MLVVNPQTHSFFSLLNLWFPPHQFLLLNQSQFFFFHFFSPIFFVFPSINLQWNSTIVVVVLLLLLNKNHCFNGNTSDWFAVAEKIILQLFEITLCYRGANIIWSKQWVLIRSKAPLTQFSLRRSWLPAMLKWIQVGKFATCLVKEGKNKWKNFVQCLSINVWAMCSLHILLLFSFENFCMMWNLSLSACTKFGTGGKGIECGGFWKDPQYQRGGCVNALRSALRSWAKEVCRKYTHRSSLLLKNLIAIETSSQTTLQSHKYPFSLFKGKTRSILYWHRVVQMKKRGSVPTHFGGLSNVCQMNRDEEKECRYLYCSSKLCTPRTKSHPVFYWRGSFPKHPYVHLSPSGVFFLLPSSMKLEWELKKKVALKVRLGLCLCRAEDQIASLLCAAESIMAVDEMHSFMVSPLFWDLWTAYCTETSKLLCSHKNASSESTLSGG